MGLCMMLLITIFAIVLVIFGFAALAMALVIFIIAAIIEKVIRKYINILSIN